MYHRTAEACSSTTERCDQYALFQPEVDLLVPGPLLPVNSKIDSDLLHRLEFQLVVEFLAFFVC